MVTLITEKLQNQTLEDVKAEANMPITQVIVGLYFLLKQRFTYFSRAVLVSRCSILSVNYFS